MNSTIPDYESARERINRVYEIITFLSNEGDDKIHKVLEEATSLIGMEIGVISTIKGNIYEVSDFVAPEELGLHKGKLFSLDNTYCSIAYHSSSIIDISHMEASQYCNHPCYTTFGLESYIGVPIWINNEKYGTLSFASSQIRVNDFNQFDRDFVLYLGQWISNYLSRNIQDQELMHKNGELQKLLSENDKLIKVVIHDLKAPLNNVKTLTNLMSVVGASEKQEVIHLMNDALNNCYHLIGELEQIHYLEFHKKNLQMEEFELVEFLQNLTNQFTNSAAEKNINIQFTAGWGKLLFYSDPLILNRIITNLISNAIKFSPFNKSIVVKLETNNRHLEISVADQGPGLTEKDQQKLFKRFQKLSARPTNGESSSGLGLFITKELSDRLNARISVETTPGQGARFIISFPKANIAEV